MKKGLIIAISLILLGGAAGGFAYKNNQDKKNDEAMAMKKSEAEAMTKSKDAMAKTDEAMTKTDDAKNMTHEDMAKHGNYITLADYKADASKYSDTKKVYFFHASWCPICQGIDKEINADMTKIPAGVTLIKTDFDSETALRQKYGVTVQYTFVQFDNSGNQIAKWSATNLDKVIAGIKS